MRFWLILLLILVFIAHFSLAIVLDLTKSNFSDALIQHDFVLVNFYARWCRFSELLEPIFDKASLKVADEFKSGNVVLARVDCDSQSGLCGEYTITKFPTLRLFKFGQKYRSEYRNQRSEEAFMEYLRSQTADPIKNLTLVSDLDEASTPRNVLGIFPAFSLDGVVYNNFRKLAYLIDDCTFYRVEDKNAAASIIKFVPQKSPPLNETSDQKTLTPGISDLAPSMVNFEVFRNWATERCTPFVRELTFFNAEEITEPRLPLLILFYPPHDPTVSQRFSTFVEKHFFDFKNRICFLIANGEVFSHPLAHMRKSVSDLPVLAIDSFQHMFLYPGDLNEALSDPIHIKIFLDDLASEKLHRRFHGLADTQVKTPENQLAVSSSVFKLLAPSSNRYSLIKDEL